MRPIVRRTNLLSSAGACETKPALAPVNWPRILCITVGHYRHSVSSPDYNGAYGRRAAEPSNTVKAGMTNPRGGS